MINRSLLVRDHPEQFEQAFELNHHLPSPDIKVISGLESWVKHVYRSPCLPDDLTLAEALLSCGPAEATIDRGASHRLFVHFPARIHDRFPALPTDVEIVRCVRSRVGFSFEAGVAAGPSAIMDADPAPFAALHSKRP